MFPKTMRPSSTAATAEGEDNVEVRAHDHYRRAVQALRDADWTRFGEEFRKLGDLLGQKARPQ